ncbi:MAG: prepilin peptidase [Actinomycetales bacterium]|nr:prepilin peptidase [Actinomycetales bacterium]
MNPWGWLLLAYIAVVTVPLVAIDLRSRRMPNRLVMPGYLVAIVSLILVWATDGEFSETATPAAILSVELTALISGAAYILFLLLLSIAGGMGMGDVKLAGVLGVAAGLLGPSVAVLSPLLAFGVGGLASAVILITRRGTRASRIPFGPFMLLGFWIAVALGLFLPR